MTSPMSRHLICDYRRQDSMIVHRTWAVIRVGISAVVFFCFFFQAEDGIRDLTVTGVQTCALPIFVGLWTGPWWGDHSPTKISLFKAQAVGCSALASTCTAAKPSVTAVFNFTPLIAGTAILTTWIIVLVLLIAMGRLKGGQLGEVLRRSFHQMWGACLVGVFIFGLAYTFNYSGMAASLAKGFSSMGTAFIIVAPVLGFIGVALLRGRQSLL